MNGRTLSRGCDRSSPLAVRPPTGTLWGSQAGSVSDSDENQAQSSEQTSVQSDVSWRKSRRVRRSHLLQASPTAELLSEVQWPKLISSRH